MSDKLDLNIRTETEGPTLTVKMNLEQFEIFIKQFPNLEALYNKTVADMLRNTGVGEKEIKVLMASQILQSLNSAMPREKPK